jgi:hypothetical protein
MSTLRLKKLDFEVAASVLSVPGRVQVFVFFADKFFQNLRQLGR